MKKISDLSRQACSSHCNRETAILSRFIRKHSHRKNHYFQTSCFPFGNHGTLTKDSFHDWDGHCDDVVGDYCEMMVIRIQEVCMMVTMLRMRITD